MSKCRLDFTADDFTLAKWAADPPPNRSGAAGSALYKNES